MAAFVISIISAPFAIKYISALTFKNIQVDESSGDWLFTGNDRDVVIGNTIKDSDTSDGVTLQNGMVIKNSAPEDVSRIFPFSILDGVGVQLAAASTTLRLEETPDLTVFEYGSLAPPSGMGLAFYNTQDMRATLVLASTTPDKATAVLNGSTLIGVDQSTTTPNAFYNSCSANGFDFLACDDEQFGGDLGVENDVQIKGDGTIGGDFTVASSTITVGGTGCTLTTRQFVVDVRENGGDSIFVDTRDFTILLCGATATSTKQIETNG